LNDSFELPSLDEVEQMERQWFHFELEIDRSKNDELRILEAKVDRY
jgi:hypothetical protein